MYYYTKGDYIYKGDKFCGSPVKEIRTITDQEAKYWDNIEKQIKRQQNNK